MKQVGTSHHNPVSPPVTSQASAVLVRLTIAISLGLIVLTCWNVGRMTFTRTVWSSPHRSPPWWEGLHTHADGHATPKLELVANSKNQIEGFFVVGFNNGLDLRLPLLVANPTGEDVIFAVENPHSRRQPREFDWYVLRKTQLPASKLYKLKLGLDTPTSTGTWIPTNLDEHHHCVASMTKFPGVSPGP